MFIVAFYMACSYTTMPLRYSSSWWKYKILSPSAWKDQMLQNLSLHTVGKSPMLIQMIRYCEGLSFSELSNDTKKKDKRNDASIYSK